MSEYTKVKEALEGGADPAMLCATCPWDRFCITPPSMTAAEVKQQMDDATAKDQKDAAEAEARGEKSKMPVGLLVTALAVGGRDTSCQVCPVLALRLRTSDGERIVQSIRQTMRAWDDETVSA